MSARSAPSRDEQAGELTQRVRGVGDAVERALEIGDVPALLHLAGEIDERGRADHHVGARGMGAGDVEIARVARDAGAHPHAECLEQRLHHPEFAGEVELAEDIDVHRADVVGLVRADHVVEQGLAGELVAEILRADEARRMDRHDRRAEALGGAETDGVEIVADQRGHAGRIDEDGRRGVRLDDLADGLEELLLALAHHHVELGEVGGEAHAARGPGRTTPRRGCPRNCPRRRAAHG